MIRRFGFALLLIVLAVACAQSSSATPAAPSIDVPCVDPTGFVCGDGIGGAAKDAVGDAVGGAASAGFDSMAKAFGKQAGELVVKVSTAWTKVPTTGAGQADTSVWLSGQLAQVTAFAAVLGLIAAAVKLAVSGRGQDLTTAGMGLLRMAAVTSAGAVILTVVLSAGDLFSQQIIGNATEDGFNSVSTVFAGASLGSALTFLLGLLAILTCIIQIGLLLVRSALLVVLAGVWPLTAAASIGGEAGAAAFKKVTGWIIAFALYKPAAAIIYAAAFKLMSSNGDLGDQALTAIQGLILLVMAVVALPAIVRLVVPATAAMGNGMSGGAVAAGAATVAIGAVSLAGTGGASGAAGASGASGPAGGAGMAGAGGGDGPSGGSSTGPAGGSSSGGGGGVPAMAGAAAAPAKQALDPASHDGDSSSGSPSGASPSGASSGPAAAGASSSNSTGSSSNGEAKGSDQ